jgi:hypothetical protein
MKEETRSLVEEDKAYTAKKENVNEEETTTSLHESMAVKKGALVFDKLVKKWCK